EQLLQQRRTTAAHRTGTRGRAQRRHRIAAALNTDAEFTSRYAHALTHHRRRRPLQYAGGVVTPAATVVAKTQQLPPVQFAARADRFEQARIFSVVTDRQRADHVAAMRHQFAVTVSVLIAPDPFAQA